MIFPHRLMVATRAAALHLLCSLIVALVVATLVFGLWYPYPYGQLAGGRELFLILISVDVVCGPLLTLVLFSPAKPKSELWRDLSLVGLIQLAALAFGIFSVWQARPLYLVMEIDRFRVIALADLMGASVEELPHSLKPNFFSGPKTVAIREPKDRKEQQAVLLESLENGRDFGNRPDFYLPYEGAAAIKSLTRAKPLALFLQKYPSQQGPAQALAAKTGGDLTKWAYVPVRGREDWVAVLNSQGQIDGFLRGDGF